ncbi:hypothetical protein BIFBIF_00758 [Bifidobacterium bifidum ATCC 29521 = JCM 1255 = DSM 20456]|nr:hypothetical protein BIFBIF_00758 [Bifidobacterium bifidum ATCC 29521 = JCM 1255 = DSM 20456]
MRAPSLCAWTHSVTHTTKPLENKDFWHCVTVCVDAQRDAPRTQ